ncbi:MAG: replicative DNA helicase [Bacteroidetes bacterium]|nr:replicative DNA helicase [Bacteroidota bacterium]MBS1740319.1 replicative DNA helicase [Bacteroidota bacterium]
MAFNIKKDLGNNRTRKPDLTTLVYGKVPPQANELEQAVLGAIMLEKDKLAEVLEIIMSADCFYVDAHQKIYGAIRRLFDKGMPVDLITVTEELRKSNDLEIVGGAFYLSRLTEHVISSAHVEAHARIVMEKFIQRELIRISGNVIADAYEDSTDVFDLLDKAESNLYEITDKHLRKNFKSLKEVLVRTVQDIEDAKNRKEDVTGVPTGFKSLDRITSGWQKNALIIVAARPAVGKTAFCLNLAMNAAMNSSKPFPVAFFSLEMGAGELVKRMLSATTEVSMDAVTKGRMQEHEFIQMTQRMTKLASAPIFLDDQAALNIFELRAKARRLKQRHDIQLIIIDYLQLMQADINKGGNREQEISKISRDLKSLAKELEIPIIALSQLNRSVESRKESKMPQLSDLRESGAIEQDADMVMFLYRPEYYGINNDEMGNPIEGETHINIAKNRSGQTDVVKVQFIKEFQRFIDLDTDDFNRGGTNGGGMQPGPHPGDNPQAAFRNRDVSNFGDSKMYLPGNFQTMPSKASQYDFSDEDDLTPPFKRPGSAPSSEDTPF